MSSLLTFILAMTLNPSVAQKAQKEIDDVIGYDRLPGFEDRKDLTYIECIIKEVYRWNPPLPLGTYGLLILNPLLLTNSIFIQGFRTVRWSRISIKKSALLKER